MFYVSILRKHVSAVLLAAILVLSAAHVGLLPTADANAPTGATPVEDATSKFESGFQEKLQSLIDSGETRDYNVVIFVNEHTYGIDKATIAAEANTERLSSYLSSEYNAKNVQRGQVLSFVIADVPIQLIPKIATLDYVHVIGDGELKGELMGTNLLKVPSLAPQLADRVGATLQPDINNGGTLVNSRSTGYTGSGIKIAIIDTGINSGHKDLDNSPSTKIVYNKDYTGTGFGDTCGHGTANAGIAAGTGEVNSAYKGIAPGALLMNIKVVNGCSSPSQSTIISAVDDAVANGANVISLSVGYAASNGFTSLALALDAAVENKVVVVTAAGNPALSPNSSSGSIPANSVWVPGTAFNVITAGGINDQDSTNPNNVVIAKWLDGSTWRGTGRGNTFDNRIKPDVLAPAVNVAAPDLQTGSSSNYWPNNSGTSHAAPFVAGAAAQILQAHPDWTPAQVKAAIKQTAKKSIYPNISGLSEDYTGKGVLDVGAAVALSTSSIDMTLAYAFDPGTYTVRDLQTSAYQVQYKLNKESSLAYGISATDGQVRQTSSSSWIKMFNKVYNPQVMVGSTSVTLTDSKLLAGPRVDFLQSDRAITYITYLHNGVKIKLIYDISTTLMAFHVDVYPTSSTSFTVVQYADFDLNDVNDKARSTATGSPYTVEQKLTNTAFYIRDTTTSTPYLKYNPVSSPTEWILKYHPPTTNPDTYYNGESFNTSTGDNIVVDYKASVTTSISPYSFGPGVNIFWS